MLLLAAKQVQVFANLFVGYAEKHILERYNDPLPDFYD